jgi:hypothetical protein
MFPLKRKGVQRLAPERSSGCTSFACALRFLCTPDFDLSLRRVKQTLWSPEALLPGAGVACVGGSRLVFSLTLSLNPVAPLLGFSKAEALQIRT